MPDKNLIKFIKEARKRGFDDYQIKNPLIEKGWPIDEVEIAFSCLKEKHNFKNKVCVYLDSELCRIIEKRAKANMLDVHEQIEDILRRSCITAKKRKAKEEKLDDMLVTLFSRKR